MTTGLKSNLIIILLAPLIFLVQPAPVGAGNASYDWQKFTRPLHIGSGSISQVGDGAVYLTAEQSCDYFINKFSWPREVCATIEQFIFFMTPEIDNMTFGWAVPDGYVRLEDWTAGDHSAEVKAIEEDYRENIEAQSKQAGEAINFEGWVVYPTVDTSRSALYYANMLNWNGIKTVNINLCLFDREGFVPIRIVPAVSNISSESVARIADVVAAAYLPKSGSSYAEFASGDRVASYGGAWRPGDHAWCGPWRPGTVGIIDRRS